MPFSFGNILLLVIWYSLLVIPRALLTVHRSPLTAHRSVLNAYRSLLTAHCSPPTTYRSMFITLCSLLIALSSPLSAQTPKEPRLSTEPVNLIDLPTAGMLYHRNYSTTLEFLDEGGLSVNARAGFFDRLMIGVAYGGTNIIGVQKTDFNPHIGVLVRVRAVEETYYVPAVALGFSSQGKGAYIDSLNRYETKSAGFYAAASKNFEALGFLSIHAGIHYSLEDTDNRTFNLFAGIEKTFASIFSGMIEYDNGFSLTGSSIDRGRGLLNIGFRASIGNDFKLGLNLKDIAQNQQDFSIGNRTIQIDYAKTF
ncbi:MAG: hypothetical protein EPO24_00750 [Bacteroidetes bacterium]|nr:MAG: hypothetical protein EPO24_00750 [Bacteroidota bacterium]